MSRKNKAIALVVLLVSLAIAYGGCSTTVGGKSAAQVVAAEEAENQDEVLSDDDLDEFGRPAPSRDSSAGGVLVAIGYLGLIIGSALLPYLLLL